MSGDFLFHLSHLKNMAAPCNMGYAHQAVRIETKNAHPLNQGVEDLGIPGQAAKDGDPCASADKWACRVLGGSQNRLGGWSCWFSFPLFAGPQKKETGI